VREADAFEQTTFLGTARRSKREPYRLELFGRHLDADERPVALLELSGGTLIVTDRRVLEFRAHLEVHGAWNVKEFLGYSVQRQWRRSDIREVARRTEPSKGGPPGDIEDSLRFVTAEGETEVLVSRAPATTLTQDEFAALRESILSPQPK
jgi:hypothetical protein